MAPALVLLSGGMDSTISLYHALQKSSVDVLCFEYGQKHAVEVQRARSILELAQNQGYEIEKCKVVSIIDVPQVGSLMDPQVPIRKYREEVSGEDPSFIPYRNLVFLAIAAQWAAHWGNTEIVTGLRGGFSDCTEVFEKAVQLVLHFANPRNSPRVISYCHKSRLECLKEAQKLSGCWGALALTLTCFEGAEPPCGECLPCKKRAEGFAQLGLMDPLLTRLQCRDAGNSAPLSQA